MRTIAQFQTHGFILPADLRIEQMAGGFGVRSNPPQRAKLLAAKAKEIAQLKDAGLDPSNLTAARADIYLNK